ncbi:relaxin receptor 1-like [Anopheles aquasalis]|uniref:relaxin receptor 1-like n=1 Tax=Anopheles aquasalis TaxID=42839 RepID=UPI00215A321C|nr:relaxin receptor 1-like [Anopheles aquasalis]
MPETLFYSWCLTIVQIPLIVVSLQFRCGGKVCMLRHYRPSKDGTFVFRHTVKDYQIIIEDIQEEILPKPILDAINETHLTIRESPAVKQLSISSNCTIVHMFVKNTSLRSLNIDVNEHIVYLSITYSMLVAIPRTIGNLKALATLTITHSLLRQLDLGLFCNTVTLNDLSILDNKIKSVINSSKSSCLTMMKGIYMNRNEVQILNMDEFNSFPKLEFLSFTSNRIELVTGRVNSTSLEVLGLCSNRINQIDLCQWYAPSLRSLLISNNALNELPYCLATMLNIDKIVLNRNRITHFQFYWIAPLEYLRVIDLSFNYLTSISFNDRFPKQLNWINLKSNLLTSLDLSYVPVPGLSINVENNCITHFNVTSTTINVADLAMAGNPIDCSWTNREKKEAVLCTHNSN